MTLFGPRRARGPHSMPRNPPKEDRPYWLILLIGIGLWLFYQVWTIPILSLIHI